jgi:hypothetical protein
MEVSQTEPAAEREGTDLEYTAAVTNIASRRMLRQRPSDPPLQCVSSGYLSGGASCRSTIPSGVVTDAWARERRAGVHGDRFFHFTWHSEVWLGYGLKDGRIRGVYCPEHSADRDRRSTPNGSGEEGVRTSIALTG